MGKNASAFGRDLSRRQAARGDPAWVCAHGMGNSTIIFIYKQNLILYKDGSTRKTGPGALLSMPASGCPGVPALLDME
jgi:hypothetical protein